MVGGEGGVKSKGGGTAKGKKQVCVSHVDAVWQRTKSKTGQTQRQGKSLSVSNVNEMLTQSTN